MLVLVVAAVLPVASDLPRLLEAASLLFPPPSSDALRLLAESIRSARQAVDLTITDVSQLTGLPRPQLTYMESGRPRTRLRDGRSVQAHEWLRPKPEQLLAIASALFRDPSPWMRLAGYQPGDPAVAGGRGHAWFLCDGLVESVCPSVYRSLWKTELDLAGALAASAVSPPFVIEVPAMVALRSVKALSGEMRVLGVSSRYNPRSLWAFRRGAGQWSWPEGVLGVPARVPLRVGVLGAFSLASVAVLRLASDLNASYSLTNSRSGQTLGSGPNADLLVDVIYDATALLHELEHDRLDVALMPVVPGLAIDERALSAARVEVRNLPPDLPEMFLVASSTALGDDARAGVIATEVSRIQNRTSEAWRMAREAELGAAEPYAPVAMRPVSTSEIGAAAVFASEVSALAAICDASGFFDEVADSALLLRDAVLDSGALVRELVGRRSAAWESMPRVPRPSETGSGPRDGRLDLDNLA